MTLNFSQSLFANIAKVEQHVNDQCYKMTIELFLKVVKLTPSPTQRGAKHATGLLANQWYPMTGGGFSSDESDVQSNDGAGSKNRIVSLRNGREFLRKNGTITLTNNVHYAVRAERLGWPKPPEGQWSGTVGPYRMVALAMQEIVARYK